MFFEPSIYNINMAGFIKKTFIIFVYLLIILMIPVFLDYLFELTIRRKRLLKTEGSARKIAKQQNKPIVVFNGLTNGNIRTLDGAKQDSVEDFTGDIMEILTEMMENSAVIVLNKSIEYTKNPIEIITEAKRVSGGDLFIVSIEKNSPRVFWDNEIINITEKTEYGPKDKEIKLIKMNNVQRKIRNIYSYLFRIIPSELFRLN